MANQEIVAAAKRLRDLLRPQPKADLDKLYGAAMMSDHASDVEMVRDAFESVLSELIGPDPDHDDMSELGR